MKNWRPADIIMLILSITLSIILITIFVELAFSKEPLGDSQSKIVAGLIASIISIISMYIGGKINGRKR